MQPFVRTLVLLVFLAPLAAKSVTLGEATVNSYLNQPLDVEIALVGLEPGQHEDLRLRIANDEHFGRLGIAHDQFLNDLRFEVVNSGGRWFVWARSSRPVSEPFLDFPLHMSWPGGQLVRQYTLLLDPPRPIQPVQVTRTVPAAETGASRPLGAERDMTGSYGPVRSGETLWEIAQALKPRGITTRQMAMALLRANPQAFIDGSINKLRAGAVLSIPPRGFIEQLDAETAHTEFARQAAPRRAPAMVASPRAVEGQTAMRGAPAAAEPPEEVPPGEASADVEPPAPAEESPQDQLQIVAEQKDEDAKQRLTEEAIRKQLLVTMEEIESNRLTTAVMEEQLSRLEDEFAQIQKLVDLKDAQIAALSSEVSVHGTDKAAGEDGPSELGTPPRSEVLETAQVAPESRLDVMGADGGQVQTAITVPAAVPVTAQATPMPPESWQDRYLWGAWVVLGLLGLTALALMFRRPRAVPAMAATAGSMTARPKASAGLGLGTAAASGSAALKKAEDDFRKLARERLGDIPDPMEALEEPTETDLQPTDRVAGHDSMPAAVPPLDESSNEDAAPTGTAETNGQPPAFSDEDIAAWVKDLGVEVDRIESTGVDNEGAETDDEIPRILNELDDNLVASDAIIRSQPAAIDIEPIEELTEARDSVGEDVPKLLKELDDQLDPADGGFPPPAKVSQGETTDIDYQNEAFSMSLDLARAYLEIDDQEGARDMLEEALESSHDPDHRRQIEELLRQIG